jgi:hypothetical protein
MDTLVDRAAAELDRASDKLDKAAFPAVRYV